jgi:hypothetical protein
MMPLSTHTPSFKLLLVLLAVSSAAAHFSFPSASQPRVIGVTSRRRTQAPRIGGPFGPRAQLYAEALVEDADLDEGEEVPEDYEESVEVVPTQEKKKVKSFKELGFAGKIVRGTRNLVVVTGTNFCLGGTFGLMTGGVRGFPNLMTRKEGLFGTPWKEEYGMRWTRYSGKCYRWASIWAPVFAIWGFTDTAMTILRNGENDEFNFMLASSAAAVWHNRDKSIQRKVIVGVAYAALTYGYVKFNEYYVVGPEGWQDKYNRNEEVVANSGEADDVFAS